MNYTTIKKFLLYIGVSSVIIVVTSCGGEGIEVVEELPEYDRDSVLPEGYEEELVHIRSSIQEASHLFQMISEAGYSYDNGLLNATSKASGYSTNKQKALGLGVYCSDVSYSTVYGQSQDALNGLTSVFVLAKGLGIDGTFDEKLLSQLAESGNDSTVNKANLLTRTYAKAEKQMHSNDRAQLATIMVVGGWIEGLYLATSALKSSGGESNPTMRLSLWHHAFSYKSVMKMLDIFKDNADCQSLKVELEKIRGPVYTIINTEGNINAEKLDNLYNAVKGVRQVVI